MGPAGSNGHYVPLVYVVNLKPLVSNVCFVHTDQGPNKNTTSKTKEVLSTTTVMSSSTEDIPIMVSDEAKG